MTGRQPPAGYQIRVRGHLVATMRRAFPDLHAESQDGDTLLQGAVADQAALHGVLAQIEALGLELLEVRRLPATDPPKQGNWTPDADSPAGRGLKPHPGTSSPTPQMAPDLPIPQDSAEGKRAACHPTMHRKPTIPNTRSGSMRAIKRVRARP